MKIFVFIVSALIFIGSLYLMSLSFAVEGWELLIFLAGILGVSLAYAIPFHLMKRIQP